MFAIVICSVLFMCTLTICSVLCVFMVEAMSVVVNVMLSLIIIYNICIAHYNTILQSAIVI